MHIRRFLFVKDYVQIQQHIQLITAVWLLNPINTLTIIVANNSSVIINLHRSGPGMYTQNVRGWTCSDPFIDVSPFLCKQIAALKQLNAHPCTSVLLLMLDVPFALQTLQIFQFAAQNCGVTNVNVTYWNHYLNNVATHKYAVNTLNSIGETISVVNKVLSLVVIIFSYSLSYYIIA